MSETETKPAEVNDGFWDEEIAFANANNKEEFRQIIRNDKVVMDGIEYEFVPVKSKHEGEYRKLTREANNIDQEKDWDTYKKNVCDRACILIKDYTPEKFDDDIFVNVENIVTGWSIRAREGFRQKLARTSNGVPNG